MPSSPRWLLATVAALVAGAGLWLALRRAPETSVSAPGPGDRLFDAVFAVVRRSAVDSLDEEDLYRRAAQGVVRELDDPYAVLRLPRESVLPPPDDPLPQGLFLDPRDGVVVVVATVPGSPSDSAGVRPGDVLVGIDSVGISPQRLGRVPALLGGRPGSIVMLRVRRGPGLPGLSLPVRRGSLEPAPAVLAASLGDGTGRIRVNRFLPGIADSVRQAVAQLREVGVRGLVLDFRGTVQGGSDLVAGASVADLFLDRGVDLVVSRMRRASGAASLTDSLPSPFPGMPLAVLIDGGTAGAAEVVAGALQDHDRALVLGTPSFGRGVSRHSFSLGGGAELTLTTAMWTTPNGRQIQRPPRPASGDTLPRPTIKSDAGRTLVGGGGIVPDRVIEDQGGTDRVLAEARRVLIRAETPEKVFALLER